MSGAGNLNRQALPNYATPRKYRTQYGVTGKQDETNRFPAAEAKPKQTARRACWPESAPMHCARAAGLPAILVRLRPLATRYKTRYWWLHSGYTGTKTKKACY